MTNAEAVNWLISITADIGKAEHRDLWHYEQALSEIKEMLESETERKKGEWTTEEMAELLFNLFRDECACNFNGIDEWLPESCKYAETTCPEPTEKHGCWMQFLLQGGADMRGEQE